MSRFLDAAGACPDPRPFLPDAVELEVSDAMPMAAVEVAAAVAAAVVAEPPVKGGMRKPDMGLARPTIVVFHKCVCVRYSEA